MLQIKNTLGGGKPEGMYVWKKNEIGSELKGINESVSKLPYNFLNGSAVVLNGEIHILGSSYDNTSYHSHYKFDGTSWTSVSTLPYSFYQGSAVVLNNEIHILGGEGSSSRGNHYKWDGSSWTSVSTLPYNFFSGSAVVLNGEIHILGGSYNSSTYRKHYKFDGSSWTIVSTLPYNFYRGSAVVLNNEIHILGTYGISAYYNAHYKWDGSSWTSVSTLPYNFFNGSAVVFNNEIHILGGDSINYHYEWNGLSWTSVSTLPYMFSSGGAVVYNDAIHTLGSSNDSTYYKYHYLVYGYVPSYTFLDYVVSDKETAYPDGGEKGGYWYEKVSDIGETDKIIFDTANQLIPDAVKGMSIVHTEEITLASDSDAILHSYAGTFNHFILTTEDFDWSNGYVLAVTNITYLIIGGVAMRKYLLSGNKAVEGSVSSFIDITSTSIRNTQNGYKFIAGHTYKLYVFA